MKLSNTRLLDYVQAAFVHQADCQAELEHTAQRVNITLEHMNKANAEVTFPLSGTVVVCVDIE